MQPLEPIESEESPREILATDFKLSLPIRGGWGYSQADACVIDKNDPSVDPSFPFNGVGVEHAFVEKRIYEEMIIFREPGEKFSGIKWKPQGQELHSDKERVFDRLVFEITAIPENDWEELKAEFEGPRGYKHPDFDIEAHERKRKEKAVSFTREFWFDITSYYGQVVFNKNNDPDKKTLSHQATQKKAGDNENDEIISTFFSDQAHAIKFLVELKEVSKASPNGKYIATLSKEEGHKWLYILYNTQNDLYVGDCVKPFRCSQENIEQFNNGTEYLASLMKQLEVIPEHERDAFIDSLANQNAFGRLGCTESE